MAFAYHYHALMRAEGRTETHVDGILTMRQRVLTMDDYHEVKALISHGLCDPSRMTIAALSLIGEVPELEGDEPPVGSRWRHKNGNQYEVLVIANGATERPGEYPVTVVYRGDNGKVWSRPLSKWHRSMTRLPDPAQASA